MCQVAYVYLKACKLCAPQGQGGGVTAVTALTVKDLLPNAVIESPKAKIQRLYVYLRYTLLCFRYTLFSTAKTQ